MSNSLIINFKDINNKEIINDIKKNYIESIKNNTKTYDIRIMAFNKLPKNYAFGPSDHEWSQWDYSGLKQNTQKLFRDHLLKTDFKVGYNSEVAKDGTYITKNGNKENY